MVSRRVARVDPARGRLVARRRPVAAEWGADAAARHVRCRTDPFGVEEGPQSRVRGRLMAFPSRLDLTSGSRPDAVTSKSAANLIKAQGAPDPGIPVVQRRDRHGCHAHWQPRPRHILQDTAPRARGVCPPQAITAASREESPPSPLAVGNRRSAGEIEARLGHHVVRRPEFP